MDRVFTPTGAEHEEPSLRDQIVALTLAAAEESGLFDLAALKKLRSLADSDDLRRPDAVADVLRLPPGGEE